MWESHLTHYVRMWNREVGNFVTRTHRILVSALFADKSSLLTVFIFKNIFYFHLFPLVFAHCQIVSYSTGLASHMHLIGIHKCAHIFYFNLLNITSYQYLIILRVDKLVVSNIVV